MKRVILFLSLVCGVVYAQYGGGGYSGGGNLTIQGTGVVGDIPVFTGARTVTNSNFSASEIAGTNGLQQVLDNGNTATNSDIIVGGAYVGSETGGMLRDTNLYFYVPAVGNMYENGTNLLNVIEKVNEQIDVIVAEEWVNPSCILIELAGGKYNVQDNPMIISNASAYRTPLIFKGTCYGIRETAGWKATSPTVVPDVMEGFSTEIQATSASNILITTENVVFEDVSIPVGMIHTELGCKFIRSFFDNVGTLTNLFMGSNSWKLFQEFGGDTMLDTNEGEPLDYIIAKRCRMNGNNDGRVGCVSIYIKDSFWHGYQFGIMKDSVQIFGPMVVEDSNIYGVNFGCNPTNYYVLSTEVCEFYDTNFYASDFDMAWFMTNTLQNLDYSKFKFVRCTGVHNCMTNTSATITFCTDQNGDTIPNQ